MPRPPILVTRRLPSSVNATLTAAFDADLHQNSTALPREELLARIAGKHGLICSVTDRVDAELLDAGPALRVIANVGVGYDNIDVAAVRERGVVVTNTPDVLTEATAELTWALILGIMRRVAEGDRLIRRGRGWGSRSTSCSAPSFPASSSASSARVASGWRSRAGRRRSTCA